jgi:hypothetical protein
MKLKFKLFAEGDCFAHFHQENGQKNLVDPVYPVK